MTLRLHETCSCTCFSLKTISHRKSGRRLNSELWLKDKSLFFCVISHNFWRALNSWPGLRFDYWCEHFSAVMTVFLWMYSVYPRVASFTLPEEESQLYDLPCFSFFPPIAYWADDLNQSILLLLCDSSACIFLTMEAKMSALTSKRSTVIYSCL